MEGNDKTKEWLILQELQTVQILELKVKSEKRLVFGGYLYVEKVRQQTCDCGYEWFWECKRMAEEKSGVRKERSGRSNGGRNSKSMYIKGDFD